MKISRSDIIWLFLFVTTIFLMGVSLGSMSVNLFVISHLLFFILSHYKVRTKLDKDMEKSHKSISEINKEAIQKIDEINKSYKK